MKHVIVYGTRSKLLKNSDRYRNKIEYSVSDDGTLIFNNEAEAAFYILMLCHDDGLSIRGFMPIPLREI